MTIHLPSSDDLSRDLWDALLEVAEYETENWTLVGAQMVLLHALEHDQRHDSLASRMEKRRRSL